MQQFLNVHIYGLAFIIINDLLVIHWLDSNFMQLFKDEN